MHLIPSPVLPLGLRMSPENYSKTILLSKKHESTMVLMGAYQLQLGLTISQNFQSTGFRRLWWKALLKSHLSWFANRQTATTTNRSSKESLLISCTKLSTIGFFGGIDLIRCYLPIGLRSVQIFSRETGFETNDPVHLVFPVKTNAF